MSADRTVQDCNCEKQDFFCEYGYEKKTTSTCTEMVVGHVPECAAIKADHYKPSTSHLRLGHGAECPNLKKFIPDTNGNVRPACPALVRAPLGRPGRPGTMSCVRRRAELGARPHTCFSSAD